MIAKPKKQRTSLTKINLWIDIIILIAFLLDFHPAITGLSLHEWLGFLVTALLMVHLLLHWKWILETTKRIFGNLVFQARLNYILNILLLVAMVVVIGSGFVISREALPALGIATLDSHTWSMIHHVSGDAVIWLIALHIALHWGWIVKAWKRYIWQPITHTVGLQQHQGAAHHVESK